MCWRWRPLGRSRSRDGRPRRRRLAPEEPLNVARFTMARDALSASSSPSHGERVALPSPRAAERGSAIPVLDGRIDRGYFAITRGAFCTCRWRAKRKTRSGSGTVATEPASALNWTRRIRCCSQAARRDAGHHLGQHATGARPKRPRALWPDGGQHGGARCVSSGNERAAPRARSSSRCAPRSRALTRRRPTRSCN